MPALVETKIRLYEAMTAAKVTKRELGKRLKWHSPQVDRLLEMKHASKLEQMEAAFSALGKRLVVSVEDAITTRPHQRQRVRTGGRMSARRKQQRTR